MMLYNKRKFLNPASSVYTATMQAFLQGEKGDGYWSKLTLTSCYSLYCWEWYDLMSVIKVSTKMIEEIDQLTVALLRVDAARANVKGRYYSRHEILSKDTEYFTWKACVVRFEDSPKWNWCCNLTTKAKVSSEDGDKNGLSIHSDRQMGLAAYLTKLEKMRDILWGLRYTARETYKARALA